MGTVTNDILVGADRATITSGFVFVFGGGPKVDSVFDAAVGLDQDSRFGRSASSLGDINGDGLADIIVGASDYPFGNYKGYWGVFLGDTAIRVTDVREEHNLPNIFTLYQSFPNPFNPKTTIQYDLKERAFVTLKVYNALGQDLQTLVNQEQEAGEYSLTFDAHGLAVGTYFYEIMVRTMSGKIRRETKKMMLLSELEEREQEEYERLLLTRGLGGNDAALKELARIQYEHAGGRLKQFLIKPEDMGRNMVQGVRQ